MNRYVFNFLFPDFNIEWKLRKPPNMINLHLMLKLTYISIES